jgi:hypothetical protein
MRYSVPVRPWDRWIQGTVRATVSETELHGALVAALLSAIAANVAPVTYAAGRREYPDPPKVGRHEPDLYLVTDDADAARDHRPARKDALLDAGYVRGLAQTGYSPAEAER